MGGSAWDHRMENGPSKFGERISPTRPTTRSPSMRRSNTTSSTPSWRIRDCSESRSGRSSERSRFCLSGGGCGELAAKIPGGFAQAVRTPAGRPEQVAQELARRTGAAQVVQHRTKLMEGDVKRI